MHIVFSGNVQGVGFRWAVRDAANSLGITGWVMNCPDGTVEAACEGEEDKIKLMIANVKENMRGYLKSSKTRIDDAIGEFNSFEIRFL